MTTQMTVHSPNPIIEAIQSKRNLSIASHEVAIRKPLADVVEATITAAAKSAHTARGYRRNIGAFVQLLQDEHADTFRGKVLVTKLEHGKHKSTVFDYDDTPAAVLLLVDAALLDKFREAHKTAIHSVRTFLSVAFRDSILTQEQAAAMGIKPYRSKQKRQRKISGRRLSVMEVQLLRAGVDTTTAAGKRDAAILDMMLFAGLRREECADLRLSDFVQDNGRWYLDFTGKGDVDRKIAVHSELHKSLSPWLEVYEHSLGDDAPVFVRIRRGDKVGETSLSSQSVSDLVATYGHKAGLSPLTGKARLTPHDARRTFGRRLYDCGVGVATIQVLLGHANVETTILYIGIDQDDAKKSVDMLRYE